MKVRGILAIIVALGLLCASQAMADLTPKQQLGKLLYFDEYLSLNQNQSCATCHHPTAGFADPLNVELPSVFPVSLGSIPTLNGGRNAPTASYAAFIPVFGFDQGEGLYTGGQFWDGRADTLKDQAKGPFLNGVEMAMADEAAVIAAIADPCNPNFTKYLRLFKKVFKIKLLKINTTCINRAVLNAYDKMAEAIGAFEQSVDFRPFTSKYDYFLAGKATLTAQELNGLAIFEDPTSGNCAACHPSQATIQADGTIIPPLFTDFTYDNLGVPKSANILIADEPIDFGLGGRLGLATENGKFRVSGLRNIALTAPYAHNGFFATLDDIVHFYNTAGDGTWDPPEVDENVNREELGFGVLNLTVQEEADLVAFLKTLSDGFGTVMPANFVLPPITPLN